MLYCSESGMGHSCPDAESQWSKLYVTKATYSSYSANSLCIFSEVNSSFGLEQVCKKQSIVTLFSQTDKGADDRCSECDTAASGMPLFLAVKWAFSMEIPCLPRLAFVL